MSLYSAKQDKFNELKLQNDLQLQKRGPQDLDSSASLAQMLYPQLGDTENNVPLQKGELSPHSNGFMQLISQSLLNLDVAFSLRGETHFCPTSTNAGSRSSCNSIGPLLGLKMRPAVLKRRSPAEDAGRRVESRNDIFNRGGKDSITLIITRLFPPSRHALNKVVHLNGTLLKQSAHRRVSSSIWTNNGCSFYPSTCPCDKGCGQRHFCFINLPICRCLRNDNDA